MEVEYYFCFKCIIIANKTVYLYSFLLKIAKSRGPLNLETLKWKIQAKKEKPYILSNN